MPSARRPALIAMVPGCLQPGYLTWLTINGPLAWRIVLICEFVAYCEWICALRGADVGKLQALCRFSVTVLS